MADPFYYLSRVIALLIIFPLIGIFRNCYSISDYFQTLANLSPLNQIGVVCAAFIFAMAALDLIRVVWKRLLRMTTSVTRSMRRWRHRNQEPGRQGKGSGSP
jgi:hypothetical protein